MADETHPCTQTPPPSNAGEDRAHPDVGGAGPIAARLGAWLGVACAVACTVMGLTTLLNRTDETIRRELVAAETLASAGERVALDLEQLVTNAVSATRRGAQTPAVIAALSNHSFDHARDVCNALITGQQDLDAVALFDADGVILGINTVYADGTAITPERISVAMGKDYANREIIGKCTRNDASTEVIEFQTTCDITPALFDSSGLSVACSVPVRAPSGQIIGVVSTRLRFDRLTSLLPAPSPASGAQLWFVSDTGAYFDEDINSGRRPAPISPIDLAPMVGPVTGVRAVHSIFEHPDQFCGVFRLNSLQVLEGGGIQLLAILPKPWVAARADAARLRDASVPILAAGLCAGFSALCLLVRSLALGRAREALTAAQLGSTFACISEGVLVLNSQGRIVRCNAASETILGQSQSLLLGADFLDPRWMLRDQAGDAFAAESHPVRRVIAGGPSTTDTVCRLQPAAGNERFLSVNVAPIANPSGRPGDVLVTLRDVTAQREESLQLRRTTEELNTFFNESMELLCIASTEGKFVRLNHEWERTLGYTLDVLEGQSFLELVHPDDIESTLEAISTLKGQSPILNFENRYRCKDGSYRWMQWRATPKGNLILSAARDVTDARCAAAEIRDARAAAEKALREVFALRSALDEHSLLSVADRRGRITDVNTGFCCISGYTCDELIGSDHSLLNSGHHPREFWVNVWRTIASGKAWRGEVCNRRKDGSLYWVDSTIVPHKGEDGEIERYVSIRFDITAQKATQEKLIAAEAMAHEASVAKSEFLANMSHEIRTPMTAILGFAELVASDGDIEQAPRRRLEYIDTIRRNGEHLLSIINDILDISKIEAGKMTVESIPIDPVRLIRDAASLMEVKAAGKGLGIEIRFDTPMPASIESDPVRLRQILVNLVGNAIKFTEIGSVAIRVACDPASERLSIAVVDTGIGLTPDQQARLFGAFMQADASTTRKFGGTGLGLRISQRLADMLGGDIQVHSEPDVGSTFTLTVRTGPLSELRVVGANALAHSTHAQLTQTAGSRAHDSARLAGIRILLAEDGPDNQRLISFYLRSAGATIKLCDNGQRALESLTVDGSPDGPLADPAPFDIVLTDMQMPVMDGYTATRALRSKGCALPIVALTANAMSGDAQRCLDAGCDAYASKPIDRTELVETCRRMLDRAHCT